MRISPINTTRLNNFSQAKKEPQNKTENNNINFTSIFADANGQTQGQYAFFTMLDPQFAKLKQNSTRIFRELPSQIAISKLLNPNQKSKINIFGCSDGSEAYAYAIALKEQMGEKAKENVSIRAVDYAPYMIDLAKSGRIICSDIEKEYANATGGKSASSSPLKDEGWDKYLIKSSRPEEFGSALSKYPFLKYMEVDPVVGKTIGRGLEWYEINKEGLPDITFECGDMRDCISSSDDVENEVFVIANAGAYLISQSPDEYINLFRNIKENAKNKNVYVVIGDVENTAANPKMCNLLHISPSEQKRIKDEIETLGFKKISGNQLKHYDVKNYKDAANKIYILKQDNKLNNLQRF